jgi:uncharacterized repeat protein (TIGR01451 family)
MTMKNHIRRLLGLIGMAAVVLSLFQSVTVSAQGTTDICDQLKKNPNLLNTFTPSERAVLSVECAKASGQTATEPPIHITYTVDFYRTREQLRARGLLPNAPSSIANMTYHGGSIMQTVTVYTIYWTPNNTIPGGYKNLINRYFTDINGSAFYNINTQYYQNPGSIPMQNNSTLGGTWTDTTSSGVGNGYPGGRGTSASPLTRTDVQNEVSAALTANPTWGPPSLTKQYFVYYEQGIEQCANASSCTPGVPNGQPAYCAYHTYFTSGGNPVIYGNMPYDETWTTRCRSFSTSPNSNLAADAEISTSSHEHFEAATDPRLDAWYDFSLSGENGDKCAYRYGATQSGGHNMVLNGNPYIIQQEWSNADLNVAVPFSGCVNRYNANVDVAVNKTGPASVIAGHTLSYNITVTNNATTFEATDVALTDAVPANTTFVSFAQTAGPSFSCTTPLAGGTGAVACTRLSLPASTSATFTLVVNVNPGAPNGSNLPNTASVATTSNDPNASNNTSTVNTIVNTVADLVVEKHATTDLVIPGIVETYTLTLTNTGPSDAQNVALTDVTPDNTTFITLTQNAGTAFACTTPASGGTGAANCNVATLPVGASAAFTMSVRVSPVDTSVITNTASITANTSDPDLGNNTSTVTTTVSVNRYKQNVLADLTTLLGTVTDRQDRHKLHEASEALADALDPNSWFNSNTLVVKEGDEVFTEEQDAVGILGALIKHNNSGISGTLQAFVNRLVAVDRALADIAISQAISAGGRPNQIAQAQNHLAQGDSRAGAGKYTAAINHYKNAWQHAQKALK